MDLTERRLKTKTTRDKDNEFCLIKTKGLEQTNRIEVGEKGTGSRISRGIRVTTWKGKKKTLLIGTLMSLDNQLQRESLASQEVVMQMYKWGKKGFQSQCSMTWSLPGNSGEERVAGKVLDLPNRTQVSPLAYACFIPRLPAAKRLGLSFRDCIPEPSLVPSTQQAPSNFYRLMGGRGGQPRKKSRKPGSPNQRAAPTHLLLQLHSGKASSWSTDSQSKQDQCFSKSMCTGTIYWGSR